MRVEVAIALCCFAASPAAASPVAHRYTRAERYAGCMFGEIVPLMRRGTERERAIATAADRCIGWSQGLSAADVHDVDLQLHRAIERLERTGL